MSSIISINGTFFVEFQHPKFEQNNERKRLLLFNNDNNIVSVDEDGFEIISNEPLIVSLTQNPKTFHNFVIHNNIKGIGLESKNIGIIKEPLKLDIRLHTEFDSISYIQDIPYKKPKIGAAFTHVLNELKMIKLWVKYYGGIFGNQNLYVIDHGSTNDFKPHLPKDVNVITIPRGDCDHWNMAKYCAYFRRFLLTQYEWGIHTDCDEFLMCSEDNDFYKLFSKFKGENLRPHKAYDVLMDHETETDLNYDDLVLKQRSNMVFNSSFLKTSVTSSPITWGPGFHKCYDKNIEIENLWLFHLKMIDSKETLNRNTKIWQTVKQSDLDKRFFTLGTDGLYQAKDLSFIKSALSGSIQNAISIPEWAKSYL